MEKWGEGAENNNHKAVKARKEQMSRLFHYGKRHEGKRAVRLIKRTKMGGWGLFVCCLVSCGLSFWITLFFRVFPVSRPAHRKKENEPTGVAFLCATYDIQQDHALSGRYRI
jgi:hypothetical protein